MSLYGFATAILIIFGVITVAFGVYIIYSIYKSRKRLPLNLPIAYNFCPQYTKGYGVLLEINVKNLKNGRTLSTVIPRDLKQLEDANERELPKPLHIVCAEGRRLVVSTGDGLSSNRQIIFYLPPRAEKISRFLQETPFGQIIVMSPALTMPRSGMYCVVGVKFMH